ncbi:possible heptosyltransferase [Aliivibrio fischeri ES114]|uniref:Possible heptosyltransferase n=2 Tax=Aliivibrio fischeri TaxID=668 RepID=Q5DYK1_ALIF1|nr:possible heptosyltransferase [Aliivibrio fischeri ES114]KLU80616.1 heptosyltransferase [Aliivibrio fischeri]
MIKLKNILRNFDRYRRTKMAVLEPLLYRLLNNTHGQLSYLLDKDDIQHILIIRNNRRIGNMYFLIPFIRQMRRSYPDAHITLMLNQPWQRDVFRYIGVDEFVFSYFSIREFGKFARIMKGQRKKEYDVIILPYSSVEDTLITAMLRAKNKISGDNARRNVAFTHTFKKDDDRLHAAFSCLYLLSALGNRLPSSISHHLVFSQKELNDGVSAKKHLYQGEQLCLAYFRGARGDKRLPDSTWLTLINKFENKFPQPIQWVEILSPDITTPLREGTVTFKTTDMRHLACVLKEMDAFICCDTGPLHLADAAGVSCIGLYNKTNPEVFGVVGNNSINTTDISNINIDSIFTVLMDDRNRSLIS